MAEQHQVVVEHGIGTLTLDDWEKIYTYIHDKWLLDFSHYVWRGDRCDNRDLSPSFYRKHELKTLPKHLETFKLATRGRRGMYRSELNEDKDWWALGQHQGLDTPLLDWTRSPFVALFFAFEKKTPPPSGHRAIYAIDEVACKAVSTAKDAVKFYYPLSDENFRLVNQNGLFTECTSGRPLDVWVKEKFKGETSKCVMLKIRIPDKDDEGRKRCLCMLNKMNINYLTLFPDLYGASMHANMLSIIPHY